MTDPAAPRFFVSEAFSPGGMVTVGEDAARHMRVRRLSAGAAVVLLDGQGGRAAGVIRAIARRNATVEVGHVASVPAPPPIHALVPVADRDRMLWLAEKAAEFAVTSWRPVVWKRSRSVAPRGEGSGFQQKVRARMASALEQSGGAWLPVTFPDATADRALASLPPGARLVMHPGGDAVGAVVAALGGAPVTLAVGPEGGFDDGELEAMAEAQFRRVSLGPGILRFETAGVAALAHVRAALAHATPLETTA